MTLSRLIKISLCVLILALCFTQEVEARRKILRGRKTLTRFFMKPNAIPAYAVVILVGIGELVIGGILFILLKCCILDRPVAPRYRKAPQTPSNV